MTAGNARTRGVNPPMVGGACPFPKSDDLGSAGDSMISSMTTEKGGVEVTCQGVSIDIRPNLSLTQLIQHCNWILTRRLEDTI